MKQELLKRIPEFELITDNELREKTIGIWIEAMAAASWKAKDLDRMPFTLLIEKVSVNLVEHTRAVTLCALRIAEVLAAAYGSRISINRDYIVAGGLLHDVGKLFEYKKEGEKFIQSREGKLLRHPISGAAFAYRFSLPQEILHIIAAHSKEGDGARRTIEAVIINHADFVNFDVFKV